MSDTIVGCGADTVANALFDSLTDGLDFDIPDIDLSGPEYEVPGGSDSPLYGEIAKITNADLTTKVVNGTGTFDWLMASINAHLGAEFDKGRITGAEYTKAYVALVQAAMANAVQFLLQRDQAFWQSTQAQIAAITAKVNLATAQMNFAVAQGQAYTTQATYALTKLKLSTESAAYCVALVQKNLISEQFEVQLAQTKDLRSDGSPVEGLIGKQKSMIDQQILSIETDIEVKEIQKNLIGEQLQVQVAQTKDARTDGDPVTGVLGKQKALIEQQITSYKRDAEVKAGKMFADSWSVQKTIDEGLVPPTSFTNPVIDEVMQSIKTNNDL